ncbi:16S rRNA (uracil(1498)-N(3))-methyltransferase (EC 2.1.1.193) [uncultured Gammaproteobacteria bacterium]|uniref:16S rRNA (uracil(1498)-N(3))-methyltransferase n=1 Tax=Bathymodiolus heckerae thiotrophic gill symbiont TaxID=1052212 RepID=UPI0010B075DB|nr:16S rRNA (uracil(1498)-N(3))-methyltransferase [Bathymodiolus heckerae thiotrophic gill symbiont]CAC9591188.1 16S rRNA (uracil(1498)-N(3))-methyltransferase (EC 2.1.1.193) [uncultured Gammaproteobacteria bacterium]SHN91285.1 Ribosomal RNA small subunit methyltransferase E [Bathymodiolus heckerae thiotrophic gill symbiont]
MKQVRLYQNSPLKINDIFLLDEYGSHHLGKVLRFPQGQDIMLFNGDGYNYQATVISIKKRCEVNIVARFENLSESKLTLTLAQGIVKGEKMDFLIQKAVELGISQIVPIFTQCCVVRLKGEKLKKRTQHWQKIIIGACEQSGRSVVPTLFEPIEFEDFIEQDFGQKFVLHHRAEQSLLACERATQATIIIGPEGGLNEIEIKHAIDCNAQPLLLGSRVLRTETASLAAIANMQLLWGS